MTPRPSTQPPPAPPPNATFGPYTLVDRIAVGGMAEVFRAAEPRAAGEPRTVVLKRMLPHIAAHPDARAMFEEEARIGSMVTHPNVVEVLGRGEEHGHPYLVLEYVPGVDLWRLGRWLARQGTTLAVPAALRIVADLLSGLHAVHDARDERGEPLGIVHRDVSPSNVLLSVHGDVKLGDFGIAQRRFDESMGEGSRPQRAKGKLGYLSPEQVIGVEVDRRSDVFSAAVIAAELLMGRPLFAGSSELEILLAIRDAQIAPFLEAAESLPEELTDAVARALARDPRTRTADAASFRDHLTPFVTEPEAPIRRHLGELVSSAMGSDTDVPLATPLRGLPWEPLPSPAASTPREPVTGELPPLEYQVRTPDGTLLGPWTYARIVEAISTGTVGVGDRVSVAGGAFRPLDDVPELRRHIPVSAATPLTLDALLPDEPTERIPLQNGGIVKALVHSVLRSDDGLWLCQQGSVRKEVYVQGGTPAYVTSNLAGELLGEYLVLNGVISRGELDMALAVMPRFDGRLGDTLVALGLVEPVQLFRCIAGQVREKLLDLFVWRSGTASFHPAVPPPGNGFPLGLDPWRLVHEGVDRMLSDGPQDERWKGDGSVVRAPADAVPLDLGMLPSPIAELLHRCDQPLPIRSLGPSERRTAAVLLHAGVLRWADEQ
ncbi:MAG: protein kinase domain-containing protein [Myxococcota bacterium]